MRKLDTVALLIPEYLGNAAIREGLPRSEVRQKDRHK